MARNRFGLRDEPFSATTDERFYYYSKDHEAVFDGFLLAIMARKRLMAMTGDAGIGKTTLLTRLVRHMAADGTLVLAVTASPGMSVEDLVMAAGAGLSAPPGAGGDAPPRDLEQVVDRIEARLEEAGAGLMAVDDAHVLDRSTLLDLAELVRTETGNGRFLQVLVAGDPPLDDLLADRDLDAFLRSAGMRTRLSPLGEADVAAFIRHRLRLAGAREGLFAPEAIQRVTVLSGGLPGRILPLCAEALAAAVRQDADGVGPALVPAGSGPATALPEPEPAAEPAATATARTPQAATRPDARSRPATPPVRAVTPVRRRRSPARWAMAAGLTALLAGGALGALSQEGAVEEVRSMVAGFVRSAQSLHLWDGNPAATATTATTAPGVTAASKIPPVAVPTTERPAAVAQAVPPVPRSTLSPPPLAESEEPPPPPSMPAVEPPSLLPAATPEPRVPMVETLPRMTMLMPSPTVEAPPTPATPPDDERQADPKTAEELAEPPALPNTAPPSEAPPHETPLDGVVNERTPADQQAEQEAQKASQAQAMVVRAERQIASRRLTTPAGDNAFETLKQLKELMPDHPRIRGILDSIKSSYQDMAETAENRGRWDDARKYYERAREVDPTDPILRDKQQGLDMRRRMAEVAAEPPPPPPEPGAAPPVDLRGLPPEPPLSGATTGQEPIDLRQADPNAVDSGTAGPASPGGPRDTGIAFASRDAMVAAFRRPEVLKAVIATGRHFNERLPDGKTPLMVAAEGGHVEAVRLLIQGGANPNIRSRDEATALMYGAWGGNGEIVATLIEAGADANATNVDGKNALMAAAMMGHSAAVRALLDRGAEVNAVTGLGWTALMYAAQTGHTDVVRLLLSRGANPTVVSGDGQSALSVGAAQGHRDVVEALQTP